MSSACFQVYLSIIQLGGGGGLEGVGGGGGKGYLFGLVMQSLTCSFSM